MSIKSDLKIIGPNDRLIVVVKRPSLIEALILCKGIEASLNSDTHRVVMMHNLDLYVLKEGANVQIRDKIGQMSRELKVSLFGNVGFDS